MKWSCIGILGLSLAACSPEKEPAQSQVLDILDDSAWSPSQSPYTLLPHQTIAVCDTGVKSGVAELVQESIRIWLAAGGRSELPVHIGCRGDRIVELYPAPGSVSWYGQTSPLLGNVHRVDVPPQWAGSWTSNHEIGHLFGFGHNSEVSIMNSDEDGRFMNGGELSSYDLREIERMLDDPIFARANDAWNYRSIAWSSSGRSLARSAESNHKGCIGANGSTFYEDGTKTTYQNNYYTCRNGQWINGGPIEVSSNSRASASSSSASSRFVAVGHSAPLGCTGADGSTLYKNGVKTTYGGSYFICCNGRWINGGPIATRAHASTYSSYTPVRATRANHATSKRCTGVDGSTSYDDGVVTTYQGEYFTCRNGQWIRG